MSDYDVRGRTSSMREGHNHPASRNGGQFSSRSADYQYELSSTSKTPSNDGKTQKSPHSSGVAGQGITFDPTKCSYHGTILQLTVQSPTMYQDMGPLTRFLSTPSADQPAPFLHSASAVLFNQKDCTCDQVPQELLDQLANAAIQAATKSG